MSAFRENDRIRHEDGRGYADFVDNETIQEHIDAHEADIRRAEVKVASARESIEFAREVLAFRRGEAMAAASRYQRESQ